MLIGWLVVQVDTSPMEWSDGAEESKWLQPFPADVQQSYRRGYYAAAAFSDSKFGELLLTLDETGFTNSTIVIMTADHVRATAAAAAAFFVFLMIERHNLACFGLPYSTVCFHIIRNLETMHD